MTECRAFGLWCAVRIKPFDEKSCKQMTQVQVDKDRADFEQSRDGGGDQFTRVVS